MSKTGTYINHFKDTKPRFVQATPEQFCKKVHRYRHRSTGTMLAVLNERSLHQTIILFAVKYNLKRENLNWTPRDPFQKSVTILARTSHWFLEEPMTRSMEEIIKRLCHHFKQKRFRRWRTISIPGNIPYDIHEVDTYDDPKPHPFAGSQEKDSQEQPK